MEGQKENESQDAQDWHLTSLRSFKHVSNPEFSASILQAEGLRAYKSHKSWRTKKTQEHGPAAWMKLIFGIGQKHVTRQHKHSTAYCDLAEFLLTPLRSIRWKNTKLADDPSFIAILYGLDRSCKLYLRIQSVSILNPLTL